MFRGGGGLFDDAGLAVLVPSAKLYEDRANQILSVYLSNEPDEEDKYAFASVVRVKLSRSIGDGLLFTFEFSKETMNRLIDLGYKDGTRAKGEIESRWQ